MNYQNFAQKTDLISSNQEGSTLLNQLSQNLFNKITHDIYQEIVWNSIIYAIKIGIFAGLVMAIVGTILGVLKFTKLDLTTYTGCMLTYKNKGIAPFLAGFIFHIVMSAVFGVVYLYLLYTLQIPPTILNAVIMGTAHALISGSVLLVLDAINPCVRNKMIAPMGFAASAQGISATITYVLIHVVYAVIVIMILTR